MPERRSCRLFRVVLRRASGNSFINSPSRFSSPSSFLARVAAACNSSSSRWIKSNERPAPRSPDFETFSVLRLDPREPFDLGLGAEYGFHTGPVGANEMKLKPAVILVCTWIFSVALAAATAQSIAQESPPQTSPDLTAVENAIKQKLESARPIRQQAPRDSRLPSNSKASPSR